MPHFYPLHSEASLKERIKDSSNCFLHSEEVLNRNVKVFSPTFPRHFSRMMAIGLDPTAG